MSCVYGHKGTITARMRLHGTVCNVECQSQGNLYPVTCVASDSLKNAPAACYYMVIEFLID